MSVTSRSSFVLDQPTRLSLGRLSQRLSISQGEIVRRSVKLFEQTVLNDQEQRIAQRRAALERLAQYADRRTAEETAALIRQMREDRHASDEERSLALERLARELAAR